MNRSLVALNWTHPIIRPWIVVSYFGPSSSFQILYILTSRSIKFAKLLKTKGRFPAATIASRSPQNPRLMRIMFRAKAYPGVSQLFQEPRLLKKKKVVFIGPFFFFFWHNFDIRIQQGNQPAVLWKTWVVLGRWRIKPGHHQLILYLLTSELNKGFIWVLRKPCRNPTWTCCTQWLSLPDHWG